MVTVNKIGNQPNTLYLTIYGNSSDEKPTSLEEKQIGNGSVFIEIDTGYKYYFDAENLIWYKI